MAKRKVNKEIDFVDTMKWKTTNWVRKHQYTIREDSPRKWDKIKKVIRYYGYNAEFRFFNNPPKIYRYYNYKGYKYWAFTRICNREKLPE